MGVERARLMSACGRRANVGLDVGDEEEGGGCEMVVRKTGHSSIARESVLRRKGRKVSFL